MDITNSILRKTIVQHSIFWLLYFSFNVVRWGFYFDDFSYSFQSNLVEFAVHLILVYYNIYYLIPKYLPQRKFGTYSIIILIVITALSLIRIFVTYQLVTTEVWPEANMPEIGLLNPNYIVAVIVGEIYVIAFTASIKLGIDWAKNLQYNRMLEHQKLETELAFLRSQVQPHFFFNTLNNLYYLALSKSDQAPATILKLSDLMSYVIYKGRLKQVSLLDEIGHIQNYIDLERLRYGNGLDCNINIIGELEDKYLPPLILLPFVENCFKHGSVNKAQTLPILVNIEVVNDSLSFYVENLSSIEKERTSEDEKEDKGIGLNNTKRRLDLLYNNSYSLDIEQSNNKYHITLKMPLNDKMPNS